MMSVHLWAISRGPGRRVAARSWALVLLSLAALRKVGRNRWRLQSTAIPRSMPFSRSW